VTDIGVNQKGLYNCILVIDSNLGPILHHFWDTMTYWLKITNFCYPSHLEPFVRVTPFKFLEKLYGFWS